MFFLPQTFYEVKTTKDKGRGIFAKHDIEGGVVIGDYLGTLIRSVDEENYEKDNELYLMYYHDYASIYPDKKKPGVHLLNHSCEPNCWLYTYKGHTLFFTLRKIFAGEELTISYLLSPQDEYCKPCTHFCKCKSVLCTGSMHLTHEKYQKWRKVDDAITKQTKREKAEYGKDLQKLSSYPKTIADNPIYDLFGTHTKPALQCNDTTLPDEKKLRKRIRERGRILTFPQLKLTVYGFLNGTIVAENL